MWNPRVVVPPFDSDAVIPVLLVEQGKQIQMGPNFIRTVAEIAGAPHQTVINDRTPPTEQLRAMLEKVAQLMHTDVETLENGFKLFSSNDPYERGVVALVRGQYVEAANNLSSALQSTLSEPNAKPEKLVSAAFFLGQAQYLSGDYRQAADSYRHAASAVRDDPTLLNSLATALFKADDASGAEDGFRRLLAIREREIADKLAAPDSEDLAMTLTNLGHVLYARRKCADAQPYLLRALPIWEKVYLGGDFRLANQYEDVSGDLSCQGQYKEAADYLQRALKVWELGKGTDNLPYAEKLFSYGSMRTKAHQDALAEPAFAAALEIFEKKSPNRSNIIEIQRALGRIKFRTGDYDSAERLFSHALHEQGEISGNDSPPQTTIIHEMQDVYEAKHDMPNQEKCYRQLLAIRKQEPESPTRNQNIAAVLSDWATVLYNQSEFERASQKLKEAEDWEGRADESIHQRLNNLRERLRTIDQTSSDRIKPE